jgi:heme/copper-type cytochrome/quinol oxidase subunit 3
MEIPYTVKARPDTGLWNAKIGIWLFLASEVMLFGGLFSAYIFLRLAPEGPWPVHALTVQWGFINTLVLIFSSVTVLQAWLALKMRKWNMFRLWMFLTILCAGGFMCIKTIEYTDKFHHYGLLMHDGSNLEGHLPHEGYNIKFANVETVTLASRYQDKGLFGLTFFDHGSDGDFLKYAVESKLEFKTEDGKTLVLDKKTTKELVDAARKAKKATITLTAVTPVKFVIPPSKLFGYDATKAKFRDDTEIHGKLEDDTMKLQVDKVDLRRLIPSTEKDPDKALASLDKADAWKVLGKEWKDKFFAHSKEELELFHKKHEGKRPMDNADFVRHAFTMPISLSEGKGGHASVISKVSLTQPAETKPAAESHGADPHAPSVDGHHDHPEIAIEKKDIQFYSNFTPKYGNFYAIYFALTGLHGLHVIAGALVLSYFLLFGKKLFDKDPEHMANRVEVGGLFWHFVDLVWIFLFPLLYLM